MNLDNNNLESTFSFSDPIPNMKSEIFLDTDVSIPKASLDPEYKCTGVFDPVFVNLKIFIPKKIERIVKNVDKIGFIYEINDHHVIKIVNIKDEAMILEIPTYDFDQFPFESTFSSEQVIFIFNKERVKNELKSKQIKKFKEAIEKQVKFDNEDVFKSLRNKYIDFQIKNLTNFVFIESSEAFHSQLRSILSLKKEDYKYTPKSKKFLESEKSEFFRNILENIPGVSRSISNAILSCYGDINSLEKALEKKENFTVIEVKDENGTVRGFPEKIYNKLFRVFKLTEPDEKI